MKAYENHIQSKKHQEMILKFEVKPVKEVEVEEEEEDEEMEVEEVDSDEWEEDDPIPVTECLFCNHHSNNLDKNLNHMTIEHSFFLPDPEFLVNLEGLIEYLGAKVCIKMDYFHQIAFWWQSGGTRTHVFVVQRTWKEFWDQGRCAAPHGGSFFLVQS